MAVLAGKIWGSTQLIDEHAFGSFHRAEVKAGFCCSRHHHATKWNGFFVESGVLNIRLYQPNGIEDVTQLLPGDYLKVAPGVVHRFECEEDCVLFETYWPSLSHDDIVRVDVGGRTSRV